MSEYKCDMDNLKKLMEQILINQDEMKKEIKELREQNKVNPTKRISPSKTSITYDDWCTLYPNFNNGEHPLPNETCPLCGEKMIYNKMRDPENKCASYDRYYIAVCRCGNRYAGTYSPSDY